MKIATIATCSGAGLRIGWCGIEAAVWLMSFGLAKLMAAWDGWKKGEAE